MELPKSSDPYIQIVASLLTDVQTLHSNVFTPRSLRLTIQKVVRRYDREGMSFLTKTLPRLGRSFDKALSGIHTLDCIGFRKKANTKLPMFMGELFERVFDHNGQVLPEPDVTSIKSLRNLLFVFYKLKLPYDPADSMKVIDQFVKTEDDIRSYDELFSAIADQLDCEPSTYERIYPFHLSKVVRKARLLLNKVFRDFNPKMIHPKHGPGAVASKEVMEAKYKFRRINPRIQQVYPYDQYFTASLGHICDEWRAFQKLSIEEHPARVILVPKDSRGPRLISCEPPEFQWVQQGLMRAIVERVESHRLTRWNVHFTDQQPNQIGALLGSRTGKYATIDLKEASDRVTVGLVRLLFPEPLLEVLLQCRTQSTMLPGGKEMKLYKFAPMGSALCFPVLALTIWSILTAAASDTDARKSILVYGDDVIVKTAEAAHAISTLESFGLLVNRDKSFVEGFFRESCGMDAYKGTPVTPIRIRVPYVTTRRADVYSSYMAYANSYYNAGYRSVYDTIVRLLGFTYRELPTTSQLPAGPSLPEVPPEYSVRRRRVNSNLQRLEWHVYSIEQKKSRRLMNGWLMLLRFFAEATSDVPTSTSTQADAEQESLRKWDHMDPPAAFSVSTYTHRSASYLVKRWR